LKLCYFFNTQLQPTDALRGGDEPKLAQVRRLI
jgi:hypothetical protein